MAKNNFPSLLDGDQILGRVMDEANDRLRVTTEATVINGAVEVAIDADSGDTIAIKDPVSGNILKINADGSINVDGGGGGGVSNVNISDAAGNPLTSSGGALNVNTTGSSTVTGTVTTNEAGLADFSANQYTVTTSIQQIATSPLTGRSSITLKCGRDNSGTVFIKQDNSITASNSFFLYAGDCITLDLDDTGTIFALADMAGQVLGTIEMA